ncbi:MAG TPA: DUF2256 domain-containing protein [Chitinophagaceae bacterium]|nr:DUF2256 domain-containing protein [Chitinophagaceae bacterium]
MQSFKGNKKNLPSKVCATCLRPFTWRKKWEKVWDEIKYCSDRCRKTKTPGAVCYSNNATRKAI